MSSFRAFGLLFGFVLLAFVLAPPPLSAAASVPAPSKTLQLLNDSALAFVPNVGQAAPAVLYQARAARGTIALGQNYIALTVPLAASENAAPEYATVAVSFENAKPSPEIARGRQQRGVMNFLRGNDTAQWRSGVPTYSSITYKNLYDGIDLTYNGREGLLKGNYLVAPNVDPSQIRWRYHGAARVQIANDGALAIVLPQTREDADGRVRQPFVLLENAPRAWQTENGARKNVDVKFVLNADNTIGFALGAYDARQPLTIDPEFSYAKMLEGNDHDYAYSIAVDGSGSAYITGETTSIDFTTTPGAYDRAYNGAPYCSLYNRCEDAFVVKLAADGTMLYSTFLGGTDGDRGQDIAVDDAGRAYVVGTTYSGNFPLVNPYQIGQLNAAFLAILSPDGGALEYSTYFGGNGLDHATSVAVDDQELVYVGGYTTSFDLPLRDAFQAQNNSCQCQYGYGNDPLTEGVTDSFIAIFNPARQGTDALRFSSYYGGSGEEYLQQISFDNFNRLYAIGTTDSTDLTLVSAYDSVCEIGAEGWCQDAFVIQVNTSQHQLQYATYLGGSGDERGRGIAATNDTGIVYVTGSTASPDFPLLSPYDNTLEGASDAFLARLNTQASGFSSLQYATYLGGRYIDIGYSVAINQQNTPFVYGVTTSDNFPVTFDAIQAEPGRPLPPWSCDFSFPDACSDAFLTQFSADGSQLEYSTYFGSAYDDNDFVYALGVAVRGFDVYIAGHAADDTLVYPLMLSPIARGAGRNVFVARFSDDRDGDSLPDDWETQGVTLNGEFLDLPAMGASPDHKDIFVHADWMSDELKPTNADMQIVIEAFQRAPLTNPDGRNGINLHIDLGPDSVMNPDTGETWGSFARAGQVAYSQTTGAWNGSSYDWDDFETLKETYFDAAQNREHVFHYAVFIHSIPPDPRGFQPGGIARTIPGHEFIIALGIADQFGSIRGGTGLQKAGTFMHELGHALGLEHGGRDEFNFKPNYLSVMNYFFDKTGLILQNGQRVFDYARYALPPLDENALDESVGIQDPEAHQTFWAPVGNTNDYVSQPPTLPGGCGSNPTGYNMTLTYPALDWDCNGELTLNAAGVDVNADGQRTTLKSFEDWHSIQFHGDGEIGDLSGLFAVAQEEPFDGVGLAEELANVPPQLILAEINAPRDNACHTPTRGFAPLLVHFDGSASADPDGTIERYVWNFGDGETAEGAQVDHTYTQGGTYYATLAVYDNDGKVNLIPQALEIVVGESLNEQECNLVRNADLDVDVYVSSDPVQEGAQLTYYLYVRNYGPDAVSDAVVNFTLPNGTTFAQVYGDGSCTTPDVGMNGEVSCQLGFFNVEGSCSECSIGAYIYIVVNVEFDAPAPLHATMHVTTNANETNPQNNSESIVTNIAPPVHAYLAASGDCGGSAPCFTNIDDALNQLSASDILTILDGAHTLSFSASLRRLIVNAGAVLDAGENVIYLSGNFVNSGIVRGSAFAYNFQHSTSFTFYDALGRPAAQITLNDAGDMGDTTVTTALNDSPANGNCGAFSARPILRVFDIAPTQTANVNATLRLYYHANEANGANLNTVTMFHCENGTWVELPGHYARGTENGLNYVELAGVTNFSPFALGGAAPTSADLIAFDATAVNANQVRVTWETGSELNLLGFNLYRAAENADEIPLNAALIPAQHVGTIAGAQYEFLDDTANANTAYRYRLELARADGTTTSETISYTPNVCSSAPIEILAPRDGKKISKKNVTLKWRADACATTYEFEIRKKKPDGESVLQKSGIAKTQFRVKNLSKGNYVWRVRGCVGSDASTCGAWSDWTRFTRVIKQTN